ncbi:hypothetical protein [Hyphomonas sp.]|uniref:hypothetical protein n=1 Tax=Hyphomonas sp. TaxID=87 RepID=UPI0025BB8C31|nr:hypothetical protein [Hyphomonas sp.]|tara:strand:- start:328 stop:597 length:270 start_codon:yes stop_codon:yes gene_type:complete
MRDMLVAALKSYYVGNINKHLSNVEIYMRQPVGVGEHSDIIETIDKELEKVSMFDDKLMMVMKYLEPRKEEDSKTKEDAKAEEKPKESK